jgi:2-phospho-L-lactate guanylyltransferase (CobY/MobA/RfbA family)
MNVSAFIPIKKFSSSKNRLAKIISSSEREILAASMAKKTIDTLHNSKICNSNFTNSSLNDGLNEAIYTQTTNDIILIMHADLPRINERDLHELAHSFDMKKVSIISDLLRQGTNCLMFNSAISFDLKFGFNSYNLFTHEFKNNGLNYQDISIESLQDDLDSEEDYFKLIKYINS